MSVWMVMITQVFCHSIMPVLTQQEAAVQGHWLAYPSMFPLFNDAGLTVKKMTT